MFQPGDRHDVADAGRRERRSEVAVDAVAQADQDARGEAGLGLGEDAGQRLGRAAPQTLEPATRGRPAAGTISSVREVSVPTAPIRSR